MTVNRFVLNLVTKRPEIFRAASFVFYVLRPFRREVGVRFRTVLSGAGLSVSFDDVFVRGQLLKRHRASGMQLLRADPDFGSEAELGAVRKGGRYVGVYAGGVDPL